MVSRGARFDRFGDVDAVLDDAGGREDANDDLGGGEVGKLLGRLSICSLGPIWTYGPICINVCSLGLVIDCGVGNPVVANLAFICTGVLSLVTISLAA
jgi:hypothetical protein